jgi:phosphonate transport system substrate-binding protein
VLARERYAGRPIYYSDVIVHRDSPITSIEELQVRSWAYNDPASHSGYSLTLYELVRMGARTGFFSRVVEAGFHQYAIRMVAARAVDAAAIDSQVLAVELRDHPRLAACLRVIGPFGRPPSSQSSPPAGCRDQLQTAVRDVSLALGGHAGPESALAQGFVERFVVIHDGDYDDIRAMLAAIHAAGYTTLRWGGHPLGKPPADTEVAPAPPDLRRGGPGWLCIAVANLRVAVTQRIQQDGEWRDGDTSFLRVNVWRGQAEHLADSLSKGDRVMVTGRLRQRSWETPEGDKRSVTEIEADEVGASLKWATAKVERTSQRSNGDRAQGRERQAERGGDFNDAPPF